MQEKYDVLILAGGEMPEGLKPYGDAPNKALLKVAGKTLIEHVIDGLGGVPGLGRTVVVGPTAALVPAIGSKVWKVMEPGEGMIDNLRIGMEALGDEEGLLLVATSDIPLVKSEMIVRFLESCKKTEGDLYYPIVEKSTNEKKYPETKRTYVPLREGVYTGGNVVLLRPRILKNNWKLIEEGIAARKSPLKLLRIIGLKFIFLYVFKMLSLAHVEKKVSQVLGGVRLKAVEVEDAEIGIDVDKGVDFELVKKVLEGRS